jgi:hypothetical protein
MTGGPSGILTHTITAGCAGASRALTQAALFEKLNRYTTSR